MSDQQPALDQIFSEAIDLPQDERRAFLAQACRGDADKLQEAYSLLEAYEQSSSFLESPVEIDLAQIKADENKPPAKSLAPGARLRQYQIKERIGAGGMGEVYSARDTNLERDVAVKVLNPALAQNPVNLARLEREARAIAALSHPNILAVYDFGIEDGIAFLVCELLAGETLRQRLAQGALPLRKVEEIGWQVARGLAAAHDKAIVHRDLKPENIFLDAQGMVKILDFGLATAGGASPADGGGSNQSIKTVTNLTVAGTVLGTVNYMSPEQVKGSPTDNRSDIFSFGSVLYEMVTGERPFQRETFAETMTAILKDEPKDLMLVAGETPPALAAIVRRCLEKHAGERFHSAHDLAFSLQSLSGSSITRLDGSALTDISGSRKFPGLKVVVALVLAGLLVGSVAATWFNFRSNDSAPLLFTPLSSRNGTVTNARFLNDGRSAIYSANWDGNSVRVFPSSPGSRVAKPLAFENTDLLSVSSSGELALSLDRRYPGGFEAIGTLAVARPNGAAPRRILDSVLVADWSPDGKTMAVAHELAGVVRLEYPIGTVLYESEGWISHLRVHPDGEQIVFVDCPVRGDNMSFIKTIDRDGIVTDLHPGGAWGVLWDDDGESVWSASGHNLYRCRLGGRPRQLSGMLGALNLFDINANGEMLVSVGTVRREMLVLAPGATAEANLGWLDWSSPQVISNDGRIVVFEEGNEANDEGYSIYVRDSAGGPPLLLGFGSVMAMSPDAQSIAVGKGIFGDNPNIVITPIGTGESRPVDLAGLELLVYDGDWVQGAHPDNEPGLLLTCRDGAETPRLYFISLQEGVAPRAITPADFPLSPAGQAVTPDGTRVVVKPADGVAVEFGLDGTGPRSLAGVLPGDEPLEYGLGGRILFVRSMGAKPAAIYRVDLETGDRILWRELSPEAGGGVFSVEYVLMSQDGAVHVYSFRRTINRLGIIAKVSP